MSHLGLMSPWAKGDSWAPHAGWLASESPGISPPQPPPCRPGRPQCFAKIPIPHPAMGKTSLQGPAEVKAWRQLAGRQSGFPSSPGPVLLPGRGGGQTGERPSSVGPGRGGGPSRQGPCRRTGGPLSSPLWEEPAPSLRGGGRGTQHQQGFQLPRRQHPLWKKLAQPISICEALGRELANLSLSSLVCEMGRELAGRGGWGGGNVSKASAVAGTQINPWQLIHSKHPPPPAPIGHCC